MLEAVKYYHKELHLGCCSSPRSYSDNVHATCQVQVIRGTSIRSENIRKLEVFSCFQGV